MSRALDLVYDRRVPPSLASVFTGLLLVAPVAPAPADEAIVYRDLQARTGLDLERVWTDYQSERRDSQGFYEFTRARYRRRLGAGIGLSIAGLGLAAAGMAIVLIAAERDNDVDVVGGALVLTAGFGLAVPGAILGP
ncbi:hypothetical protein OV079_19140 [Nannocystis pusilla]|uniref:Uncharacterized protein n=1 Tax=Nannocystis pusilla TaxID=889268 RepID=A0A9X3EWT5_9BACT|nr:hypothetical protein [Nannocystis pusilla]MCY1007626.1 hypothetical protein [Nannocystis pusilla]